MTQRHPRVACLVPFCRRGSTRWPPPYEIICGDHYRLTDKSLRRNRVSAKRRLVKLGEWEPGPEGQPISDRAWRIDNGFWRKIKRQAIERAVGITA